MFERGLWMIMSDKNINRIYYVSNLNTCRVSIIDGNNKSITKEIEIGSRPQDIIVDENNRVFIASDRNNKVTVIEDLFNNIKILDIHNNGNIDIDAFSEKIYAGNTEEIGIYNLNTGEKINSIKGFIAADRLKIDKSGKRLFVLDILQKMIKVYDTEKFNLINLYKDVGVAPVDFLLGEDEKYIYVADKGTKNKRYKSTILIVDIKTKNTFYIPIQKESVVTSLEHNDVNIYAANIGFKRIDVINIDKKQYSTSIATTLPNIIRIRLSKDKKILCAISCDSNGKSVIDIIDTNKNIIIDSIFLEGNNFPYDIGAAVEENLRIEEKPFVLMSFENETDE
jgi:DNA-binding beta-propeller fold protein YncE